MRKNQSGVMLLEALIAILVFSLGVLGIVAMQASAIGASRDAKFRADAGLLASELVGQMWSGNRDGVTLQNNFQSGQTCGPNSGSPYCVWLRRVEKALPGVSDNLPEVVVGATAACATGGTLGVAGPPQTSTQVCITVRWRAPNDTDTHRHRVVVQII